MATPMPYDEAKADIILERLVSGESLRKICKDENLPSIVTVFKWLAANDAFAKQYARAREEQADTLFDESLDIADETKEDYVKRLHFEGATPEWVVNGEAIARAKLRIDTRKWMAGKLRPKKYGDQIAVDQTINAGDGLLELLDAVNGKTRTK